MMLEAALSMMLLFVFAEAIVMQILLAEEFA